MSKNLDGVSAGEKAASAGEKAASAGEKAVVPAGVASDPPLVITRVRLLDPLQQLDEIVDLLIHDGCIVGWGHALGRDGVPEGSAHLDGDGLCAAPGLVDLGAELRDSDGTQEQTLDELLYDAVVGGVTQLAVLAETDPIPDRPEQIVAMRARADALGLAEFLPYAALSRGRRGEKLTEFGLLLEAGAVGFCDGARPIANSALMRAALSYARSFSAWVAHRALDPYLSAGKAAYSGEMACRLGLASIPAMAEAIMIERDLHLVEATGGWLHFSRVSTEKGVAAIRRAKQRGLPVSCDVPICNIMLNELAMLNYDAVVRLDPPLSTESNRMALVAGLCDGTIDAITSSHAPRSIEHKLVAFEQAAPGAPSLSVLLPLVLGLVHEGMLSLLQALALITYNPARLLGLGDSGRIRRQGSADLVLFDMENGWVIRGNDLAYPCPTPFEGRPVQGRIRATIRRGVVVYESGAKLARAAL